PPANSVRPPAVAAAASCRGEGSRPITRPRAPSTRTIEATEASAESSPPIASSDEPRVATAGSSTGAGRCPAWRTPRRAEGVAADLALAGAGVLDDVLGLALGLLGDLLLRGQLRLALARLLDDALGLALGLRQHLLALLDDPARLLDLLRDRRAHLVEDVVDLLLVHAHGPGHGHRLGVVDQIVQLVDEYEDVHWRS